MKIETLDTFCQVVEKGSISKVAKMKFISQPAITRQIRQLEEEYNTLLFNRMKGSLVLTKEGEILYKLFKEIVSNYLASFEIIEEIKGEKNLNLTIGSSLTIGEYLLPSLLGEFKKVHEDTNIKLDINSTPKMISSLKNDRISIALVEGEVTDPELETKKFAEDELVVFCSTSHLKWDLHDVISLDDLMKEKIICREKNSGTRKLIDKLFRNKGFQLDVYMELGSTQAIKKAVELDLGIGILSKFAVENELENGSLKRVLIDDINLNRDLWMVQKRRMFRRSIEEDFYNFVIEKGKSLK